MAVARRLLAEARDRTGALHGSVRLDALSRQEIEASAASGIALPAGAHWKHLSMPKPLASIDPSVLEETEISFGLPVASRGHPGGPHPSIVSAALEASGRRIGMICVELGPMQAGDQNTREALEVLAASAAQAIAYQRLGQRLDAERGLRITAQETLRETHNAMIKHQQVGRMGDFRYNTRTGESFGSLECYKLFGFDPMLAEIDFREWTSKIVPEDRQRIIDTLADCVSRGAPLKFEYRIELDGEIKYIACEGALDVDHVGDPTYYGVLTDVTERRRYEARLSAAQQELATAVRLASLGELAASIIHEVSQPITAIRLGAASALRWLDVPGGEGEVRESLNRMSDETARAASVIGGLRALARSSVTQLAEIDIIEAVREALTLIEGRASRERVSVATSFDKTAIAVCADRVQIQQVVVNLANNALDAMLRNGEHARQLHIACFKPDAGHFGMSFADTGPGFTVDNPERLFDPLYSTKAEGMGLGLAICRKIVHAHRGEIVARVNEPRGAIFEFTMPLMENSGADRPPAW
ncbi:ATP-binding protein [Paraburkholderia sp. SARCC-3016]|uniref:PAS domain-containing sensor histidine kinase n=1 Tax=Paraburkholderia sp. SARCC-3016 TaxID=3058611 RepID=UPI002807DB67|nr:ATP-binding protein [Paraburkholderia sp. SARCC-3016]MDQ7981681.1 ATP-binding protein [Paraburkholderia sp. SARCC-3016]